MLWTCLCSFSVELSEATKVTSTTKNEEARKLVLFPIRIWRIRMGWAKCWNIWRWSKRNEWAEIVFEKLQGLTCHWREKTEEEIERFTIDENMSDIDRSLHLLKYIDTRLLNRQGIILQKLCVVNHLPQLIKLYPSDINNSVLPLLLVSLSILIFWIRKSVSMTSKSSLQQAKWFSN